LGKILPWQKVFLPGRFFTFRQKLAYPECNGTQRVAMQAVAMNAMEHSG